MANRAILGFNVAGDAGAKYTLERMADLVRQATLDAHFVWWARSLVAGCEPRDEFCQATTLREFVRARIHFCRDPVGVENVTPPLTHARLLRDEKVPYLLGDCDDAATLSAALGMAIGLPARFTILAFNYGNGEDPRKAPYQHVFTSLVVKGRLFEMDTTRPDQMLPPKVARSFSRMV